MRKLILPLLALCMFAGSVKAQNYFDDKWFDKPVKHRISYTNERYRIKKIVRNNCWTVFEVMYNDPYRAEGWMYLEHTIRLKDQDTDREYYMINSTGIPKEPDRFDFKESGPVEKLITLWFPPLPETVKTITLIGGEMSFYDVALSSVKPQLTEGIRTVTAPPHVSKNPNLVLDRVITDNNYTALHLTYTAPKTTSVNISMGTTLTDPATGKSYKLLKYGGIPAPPQRLYMQKGSTLSFYLIFQALPATVKKIKMVESLASNWNIDNIILE